MEVQPGKPELQIRFKFVMSVSLLQTLPNITIKLMTFN